MTRLPSEPSTPLTRAEEKSLQALAERSERRGRNQFLAEGVRVLEEALRHGVSPETLFVDAAGLDQRSADLRRGFEALGVLVRIIPTRQLEKLSSVDHPQGVIGLFLTESKSLSAKYRPKGRTLWCHGLSDPGNLGTLCRSALAFGVTDLICSGDGVDPRHPRSIRASAGGIFGLQIIEADVDQIIRWRATQSTILLALGLTGDSWRVVRSRPEVQKGLGSLMIAVGSEAHGLPSAILDAATHIVRIEQDVSVESLNAAVAGSILLYETRE